MEHTGNHVADTIREYRLRGYDWNGCGGLPLRDDAATTAIEFYQYVYVPELPTPTVLQNPDGSIEVGYGDESSPKKLLLTFYCYGVVGYVKVFADDTTYVEGLVRFDPLDETPSGELTIISDLFRWMAQR